MKFTKLGIEILDNLVASNDKAYRRLRRTTERVEESDKKVKLTKNNLAELCWLQCKGMCAPFRYNGVVNNLCNLCPGGPPNKPDLNHG